jgi:hypothetical protein
MTFPLLITLSVMLTFALVGPLLARGLPPAVATRLLVPASLVVGVSAAWALLIVGFTWVAQLGPVSRYGDWSPEQLRAETPFPTIIAVGCGLVAVGSVTQASVVGTRRIRRMLAVRHACGPLGEPGSLVVLDDDRPDAFATPGAGGQIVVTTGLLRALTAAERRALIAHEKAHLTHRHAWWLLATEIAAAANPLLRPTASAIEHAVERWADEDAAREVTDRRLVARTLARTALLTRAATTPATGLAAAGGDVPCRVRALLAPPPRPRILPLTVLLALLTTCTVASATVQHRGDQMLHRAGAAPTGEPPAHYHHHTKR